jgi:hypothetical protein
MPWKRSDYPSNWEEVSHHVRFERAGGTCEAIRADGTRCNAPHGEWIGRHTEKNGGKENYTLGDELPMHDDDDEYHTAIKVILTTAHICECSPICSDPEHLRAWCQLHHLRYDSAQHTMNARATRRKKLNMDELFNETIRG